jgi:hypothetical protein
MEALAGGLRLMRMVLDEQGNHAYNVVAYMPQKLAAGSNAASQGSDTFVLEI